MHEKIRHRMILSAVSERPVATVAELCELTGVSEATIRRDIATLHEVRKLRKVRGGAESIDLPAQHHLAGHSFEVNAVRHVAEKRLIAEAAVSLCEDGESIIINGGTTTFQMVHPLAARRLEVFTNSLPIANHLLAHSDNTITVAGGTLYREQNIILSPFDNDVTRNFYAHRLFMGAQGIGRHGLMEADPLLVQAESKLIGQTDELVVLVDSSKFANRSSLVLCPLERIDTLITDDGIDDATAGLLEGAGIRLIVVEPSDQICRDEVKRGSTA